MVRRAVTWLEGRQNLDGGWGESNDTYLATTQETDGSNQHAFRSTPFQTAWALLGLLAAGEHDSEATRRGIHFLLRTQQTDGLWNDPGFTAPGFPRVFYLRYHGYCRYFPLWALAAYRSFAQHGTLH